MYLMASPEAATWTRVMGSGVEIAARKQVKDATCDATSLELLKKRISRNFVDVEFSVDVGLRKLWPLGMADVEVSR
jgi:hypothetical protein